MRFTALALFVIATPALAQTPQIDDAIKAKLATVKWVYGLEDPNGGFYVAPRNPATDVAVKPSLRATSAAVRAITYSGAEVPNKDKHAAFVLKCYDPGTGGFAEPGGKPDVAITSVGVMAAAELGIPYDKIPKAMEFLKANAKTFEDVRIGAAAVEAWGVKDCPFNLADWHEVAVKDVNPKLPAPNNGGARFIGSYTAFMLRLGLQKGNDSKPAALAAVLDRGQLPDGGWNKEGEKASDVETTYRVMRAYMLLKEKPKDAAAVRKFLASHRNADGGYGTTPGGPSNVGGTYYAVAISKWLDAMEK